MNFYPQVRVQISTRNLFADGRVIALPDPNPTGCHPYSWQQQWPPGVQDQSLADLSNKE
jgi:hypothetical protein